MMKKFYLFLLSGWLLLLNSTTSGQAVLIDDNNSLSGIPFNGKLILSSDRDSTLWTSNGTQATTQRISSMKTDNNGYGILNNKLYFAGLDASHGSELWATDGTAAGTVMVSDIWPGADSSKPGDFITHLNKLYFTAQTPGAGRELYEYTGDGPPVAITDLNTGAGNSFDRPIFFVNNNLLYFDAMNNTGKAIYILQTLGVSKILDLPGGFSLNGYCNIGNTVFFSVSNGSNGMRIYKSSGGAATLVQAFAGPFSGMFSTQLINWNNKLFFTVAATGMNNELWVTDGNTTQMVKDINPGENGSFPIIINSVVLGNKLLFSAQTDDSGYELWTTDGTADGTSMLVDININEGEGSAPMLWPVFNDYTQSGNTEGNINYYNRTANYNGIIFFTADNGVDGVELYKTNGTKEGTVLVKDLNPGGDGAGYSYLYTKSGVVFSGSDGTNGFEPWMSDGTASGTNPIANINLSGDSDPQFLFIWNGDIYLIADNGNSDIDQYFDFYKLQGPYSPLPVTLVELKATAQAGNVIVNWSTSSESNSDYFEVLRSSDGQHFTAVGKVAASGNSNKPINYSFIDKDGASEGNSVLYYRLNMKDLDGKSNLSKIVKVNLPTVSAEINIYPNPAHDVLRVQLNGMEKGHVKIIDLNGRTLYESELGKNTNSFHPINISSFSPGVYILKVISGNKVVSRNFIRK